MSSLPSRPARGSSHDCTGAKCKMQRQKSILSFFQKPSPNDRHKTVASGTARQLSESRQNGCLAADGASTEDALLADCIGTHTPQEKPPRPLSKSRPSADGNSDVVVVRPFASIMHKFVKRVSLEANPWDFDFTSPEKRDNQSSTKSRQQINITDIDDTYRSIDTLISHPAKLSTSNGSNKKNNEDEELISLLELEPSSLEPETPEMQKFAPRSKRVQEETDSGLLESSKRMKIMRESEPNKAFSEESSETAISKFCWLNPASIKDANGRRPNDASYDKKTLYIPPGELSKMTASQKQYWDIKRNYMDVVLFFKVGKFYELYELDAEIGQKELDWKMTHSGVGKCRQVGISESGIDDAVQKLLARGYKVGRIEQLETANEAKSRGPSTVIRRKLVNVLTPSTMTDGSMGPDAIHLLALKEVKSTYGFAFVDCAASQLWVGFVEDDASCSSLGTLLMQVSPREVLYENRGLSADSEKALRKYSSTGSRPVQLTPMTSSASFIDGSEIRRLITTKGYFKGSSSSWSSAVDCQSQHDVVISSLGLLVDHLSRLKLDDVLRNGDVFPYHVFRNCLRMDGQTLVNLEILCNNIDGGSSGTLYKFVDHCLTAPGRRLLRRWICHPLKDVGEINDRLNVVEAFCTDTAIVSFISERLRKLPDLERLLGRLKSTAGSSSSLLLPLVGERLLKERVRSLGHLVKGLRLGADLLTILLEDGGRIPSLTKILNCPAMQQFDQFLSEVEASVDSSFPNYQDYVAEEGDAEVYSRVSGVVCEQMGELNRVVNALSCLDVLQSFAVTAATPTGPMNRPVLLPGSSTGGPVLEIRGLWHPYAVGRNGNTLVPNDVVLGGSSGLTPGTLLLTGPNMGGKSTLLRATCLAAVLAQLGCFVPGDTCVLSTVDVIFTRLGAVDRIMSGESTFYVECAETASILANATQDSLVLLDELGRGTSTFDGYAIAYAVLRHLLERVDCRLLFATHYHPLTKEFASHPRVNLQHMACLFRNQNGSREKELVFLYKLSAGPCPESYGMQVALVAGIPPQVVAAAEAAASRMKSSTAVSFRSSEGRSVFSTLHEDSLRTLLSLFSSTDGAAADEDATDTALCLWHELRGFYRKSARVLS